MDMKAVDEQIKRWELRHKENKETRQQEEHKDRHSISTAVKAILWPLAMVVVFVAVAWALGLFSFVHNLNRQITQENRAAEAVGAKPLPQEKIKIEIVPNERACLQIELIRVDGDHLYGYVVNRCETSLPFAKIVYKAIAPDGTVIKGDYFYLIGGAAIDSKQRVEIDNDFKNDPRVAKLVVKALDRYDW